MIIKCAEQSLLEKDAGAVGDRLSAIVKKLAKDPKSLGKGEAAILASIRNAGKHAGTAATQVAGKTNEALAGLKAHGSKAIAHLKGKTNEALEAGKKHGTKAIETLKANKPAAIAAGAGLLAGAGVGALATHKSKK